MSVAESAEPRLMTFEEFMALPDDGVDRELIRGELRIRGESDSGEPGVTIRNLFHCGATANITTELSLWLRQQPEPRGRIFCGEVGFRLRGSQDSAVGIDVAYVSAELLAAIRPGQTVFQGAPILAVEILSPSDKLEAIVEKVNLYHEFGVVVWVANPYFRTIAVHRPGEPAVTYNDQQELVGDPELPSLRLAVARIFEGL